MLTTLFVMLTEVLVFVPSVSSFRLAWLDRTFNTGEASSLALERLAPEDVPDDVREQLLALTQTEMIVVRRDGVSQILAANPMQGVVARHVELAPVDRVQSVRSIVDAFDTLLMGGDRVIRVFGSMKQRSGSLELVLNDKPLRDAMLTYAGNVILISLVISLVTAFLVFATLRWFLIRPMQRMTNSMLAFARDPEDADHTIAPSGRRDEIGVAEEQLNGMQNQLRGTLKQQRHLADLGLAVSKINHDLRNILASASLFSDRLSNTSDPVVQRLAPRLIRTIDRAADYTRSVLDYGKSGEAVPERRVLRLHRLCEDVAETLSLDAAEGLQWVNNVPTEIEIVADSEQLFRVLMNLSRNALQAMDSLEGSAEVKRLTIEAREEEDRTIILVSDTGPGFSTEAREKIFSAFQSSGRKGGTGLGLAIAFELIQAHQGSIRLMDKVGPGAQFEITLPNPAASRS